MIEVTEVSIAQLRGALETGQTTAVELVQAYLARIDAYDTPDTATALNAVVVRNPQALAEAQASDARRAKGQTLGPLDGIPYTAKDSYLVKGLTAASGSPAFKDLIAYRDAFTIERLRGAGAICLGKTNMPPMANGGMQRGVYGRAESPYNAHYLTAPFASGSSNGAGTATAASFSAFGLAEETWSSGRGPASNNGLCAYTPSRGVISVRGNWPLTPTMDVVVGVVGNQYYSGSPILYRVIALLVLAAVAVYVGLQTAKGKSFAVLVKEARIEIRKVVWPTRQETTQTTLIVVAVVLVMALLLWGLDSLLGWLVSLIVG